MTVSARIIATVLVLSLTPLALLAQGSTVAFGGLRADPSAPVEVTADQLSVDQTDQTAIFEGNVIIIQGEMRLSADKVRVEYAEADRTRIERMHATGHVVMASGKDAAEASEAVYTVASGAVLMTGDVLLTQGTSTIAGQKLTIDLNTGTGQMDGRVRTVIQPGGN